MIDRRGLDRLPRFALSVALSFAAAYSAHAQASATPLPSYRARLLGVYSAQSGEPIEGAEVVDLLSKTKAVTTATGTVTLVFLPEGGSMVRIQKIGYAPFTQVIAISPADTAPVTVLLTAATPTLPTVVTTDSAPHYISPSLQAFEERRRQGFGKFLTDAELRKNENRSMTNLIRQLGARVECTRYTPIRCFATSMRKSCSMDVFVNGIRIQPADLDGRDLEKILVSQTGGVEVYMGPSTVPVQYNMTGNACGAILFWMRER